MKLQRKNGGKSQAINSFGAIEAGLTAGASSAASSTAYAVDAGGTKGDSDETNS